MKNKTVFGELQYMASGVKEAEEQLSLEVDSVLKEADAFFADMCMEWDLHAKQNRGRFCRLVSLGFTCADPDDLQERREALFSSMKQFVSQQISADQSFSVMLVRQDGNVRCLLFVPDEVQTNLLLRSAYGWTETERDEFSMPAFLQQASANIKRTADLEDAITLDVALDEYGSWIDRLSAAWVTGDYCVEAFCMKIPAHLLRRRYEQAAELYRKISRCQELAWSTGYNSGTSDNGSLVVVSGGSSQGFSSQLSGRSDDYQIHQMLVRLKCEMQRLLLAVDMGGFWVRMEAGASDQRDLGTLCAVISGALRESSLLLEWSGKADGWLPAQELCRVMQLPGEAFPGFRLHQNEMGVYAPPESEGLAFGRVIYRGVAEQPFSIPLDQFKRHAFVSGMTGSGKTNTIFSILKNMGSPFLVIEPVKQEYRGLKNVFSTLRTYTMDAGKENALRINPFWFPPGANIQYHMDSLKALIISSFSLSAAMPNIIEQCIANIYLKRGWNTVTSRNMYEKTLPETHLYPTFHDLANEVQDYLDRSKYVGETLATYQGALLSRLSSYTTGTKGLLLNVQCHPDYAEWEVGQVVIELDILSDDADKAIVMGSILLQYFQYIKQRFIHAPQKTFSHLIVLEEAHRLFKNVSYQHQDAETANPQAQLVETLSNLMAEIRAYGEGIIVVDQSPVKIAPDVVRNSNVKMIHRLDMRDDIELVQNALLLKQSERVFASLKCGQALVRFEGMDAPALIEVFPYPGGTQASKEMEDRAQPAAVLWDQSPAADTLLANPELKAGICALMERLLKSILYDDLCNINEWISWEIKMIQRLLAAAGYYSQECCFTSDLYSHLMLAGFRHAVATDPLFGSQFTFGHHVQMLFERALMFFTKDRVRHKECVLLQHYRQTCMIPALQDILRFTDVSYAEVYKACASWLPYSELLFELAELYEHRYSAGSLLSDTEKLELFITKETENLLVPPISKILTTELCQSLRELLRYRFRN